MNLIDKKGRLFGRVNIVDFLIIVVFLAMIPMSLHVYKILRTKPVQISGTRIKVEAVTFAIPEFAELFKKGDTALDEHGYVDGRLLRILKKDRGYTERINVDNKSKTPVFFELELLCTKSSKNESWYYRRKPLRISLDDVFWFETKKYLIACNVLKISE